MTEWGVVGVIVALLALVTAIVTPILKLNTTVTKLTALVDGLAKDFEEMTSKNRESHKTLWEEVKHQNEKLGDHETRIKLLERK